VLRPPHTEKVWNLRAAGLGVLSNVKGPAKPIAFVEDTAVRLSDLPDYIDAFEAMMHRHRQRAVYYAHAGAGELHIRPVLNLKAADGRRDLRSIAEASARLVKQYGGSLSGEHGDGRVRSEFIPQALGPMVYDALCALKKTFDPHGILNPGKIIAAPPMDTDLRYSEGQPPFTWPTFLDFSAQGNLQEAAEACNGSGDCRKPHATGATMCPSYQATLREQDSTRARANMLREVLTHPANAAYPMDSEPLREVLDLCLSCKACKRECPSSVDMALMKAEVSWQQGRRHGFGKAAGFFGNFHRNAAWAVPVAPIVNLLLQQPRVANWVKKQFRIAPARSIPPFAARKATALIQQWADPKQAQLVLYIDEFTQYQDAHIALAAARLLKHTGFPFAVVYSPSGRSLISKGMLDKARAVAQETIARLSDHRLATLLVVGLEPSAVLGFRDEYPKLVEKPHRAAAAALAARALTFEEWWAAQVESRRVDHSAFPHAPEEVQLHLHCHQKALSHVKHSKISLSVLKGTAVKVIPSGCCGMAGSFGYEAEHYDLSMKIGELVLFPRVRQAAQDAWLVAAGTSCRHQIADGTGSQAMHPAEALCKAAGL
jgi:Fe-S oxidoreductase